MRLIKDEEITNALEGYTASNSSFEKRRNYVSLSHIHLSTAEIINQRDLGFEDSLEIRLKCYKGYQMEKDLLLRIKEVFGPKITIGREIKSFNGLAKGHPDFFYENYPGDCKSVLHDDWMPNNGVLPRRVYWQMQGYMKYTNTDKALIIYESREGGKLLAGWIKANIEIQKRIEEKVEYIYKYYKQLDCVR